MEGSDNFRLVVRRGPQPNQTYDLNKDIITLGRDITNDIVINDPEVSRHHLRLTRGAGGFTLEDLGSTNGTFINGQRLSGARPLNNGDMVGLGETVTLGYERVRAAGAAPSPVQGVQPTAPHAVPDYGYQQEQRPPTPSPYQPPSAQGQAPMPQAYPQQQGQQPYYSPPPAYDAPPATPPGAGYEYDPYAIREEEPSGATRWLVIGCGGLGLLCCCSSVVGIAVIDAAKLWDKIPLFKDTITPLFRAVATALGLI